MKILVLSDSHSALRFMRQAISVVKPDAVVHLGDYYEDARTMEEEFKHIRFHAVPGNCDKYRLYKPVPETLCYDVCGIRLFMTHGHNHGVKQTLGLLRKDARASGAQAVLYGHTHCPDCHREEDGLWVLNPGSSGSVGGSVGLIETNGYEITGCKLLRLEDLEGTV